MTDAESVDHVLAYYHAKRHPGRLHVEQFHPQPVAERVVRQHMADHGDRALLRISRQKAHARSVPPEPASRRRSGLGR